MTARVTTFPVPKAAPLSPIIDETRFHTEQADGLDVVVALVLACVIYGRDGGMKLARDLREEGINLPLT